MKVEKCSLNIWGMVGIGKGKKYPCELILLFSEVQEVHFQNRSSNSWAKEIA
jgi:hypothetical protein